MPTRILIVEADPNAGRVAEAALREQGYVVIVASEAAEALLLWKTERPDLILLDAVLAKGTGYEVATKIRAQETGGHLPIIMLTASDGVAEKVQVFRAGADAYISKPIHAGEMLARIRGLLARFGPVDGDSDRAVPGRVIAFYGAKGGVGTTTIAINAAIAMRRELHRRVALIDGRLQFGDHRIFLDLGLDRKTILDVVTAPTIDTDLLESVLVRHDTGIDLLLSPPSPESADHVRLDDLPKILTLLRTLYDYVLIDVESRLDDMTLHVLDTADVVMVVMTPDLPSLKDVRMLLETTAHLGWDASKISLVLNRASAATGINLQGVESALERPMDYLIVNEYRTAITAVNTGAPFMATKPDSPLGRSVVEMIRGIDSNRQTRRPAGEPVGVAKGTGETSMARRIVRRARPTT